MYKMFLHIDSTNVVKEWLIENADILEGTPIFENNQITFDEQWDAVFFKDIHADIVISTEITE